MPEAVKERLLELLDKNQQSYHDLVDFFLDPNIDIDDKFNVRMTGEVKQICEGILSDELITEFTEK